MRSTLWRVKPKLTKWVCPSTNPGVTNRPVQLQDLRFPAAGLFHLGVGSHDGNPVAFDTQGLGPGLF